MNESANLKFTAGDLMSRKVKTIRAGTPLREAGAELVKLGIRGAPVIDERGKCVGVLSVTDLARWTSGWKEGRSSMPRTCPFQEKSRKPGGEETILCQLTEGRCPFQVRRELSNGSALVCSEPNCVPTDWQIVEMDTHPTKVVRDIMTTTVVTTSATTSSSELARLMLEHQVHRLIVVDAQEHPIGIVTVDDLLQVLAHPDLNAVNDKS